MKRRDALKVMAAQRQADPRRLDPQEIRHVVEERRGKSI